MFYTHVTNNRQLAKVEKLLKRAKFTSIGSKDAVTVWAHQFHDTEFVVYQTAENKYSAMSLQLFEMSQKDFITYDEVDIKHLKSYLNKMRKG